MSWGREEVHWAIKLLVVAFGWWGSILCVSFVMFRHVPIFTLCLCIVLLTCFVLFCSPKDIGMRWSRNKDKIALFFNLAYLVFMIYIIITFMGVLHDYYNTGVLPDHYTDIHWPEKWYAPFIYVGAAMCPVIYGAMLINRKKGG